MKISYIKEAEERKIKEEEEKRKLEEERKKIEEEIKKKEEERKKEELKQEILRQMMEEETIIKIKIRIKIIKMIKINIQY